MLEQAPEVPAWPRALLIVGCGNMGGAMLAGWLAAGFPPARFTVVDPGRATAPAGVRRLHAARDLRGERFDAVVLGIKPQQFTTLAPGLAPLAGGGTMVLSLLAGTGLARLDAAFPDASGVVRVMPNLAAAIGKAPVALADGGLDPEARAAVTALMAPLGTPEWFPDDRLFDALTALAGSGPAFVYRFIDALAAGAGGLGIEPGQAERLALAMVEGAALLAARSAESPGALARKVASPGGTTEAGLAVLDADRALARLLAATLAAAAARGAALAA